MTLRDHLRIAAAIAVSRQTIKDMLAKSDIHCNTTITIYTDELINNFCSILKMDNASFDPDSFTALVNIEEIT